MKTIKKNKMLALTSSAERIRSARVRGVSANVEITEQQAWSNEAWSLFDEVGELSYVVNALADRVGQASLFVGKADGVSRAPSILEDNEVPEAQEVLTFFGGGASNVGQLLSRASANLTVAGACYFVGIPREWMTNGKPNSNTYEEEIDFSSLVWEVLSTSEVQLNVTGNYKINFRGHNFDGVDPNSIYIVRVWDSHPRYWNQATSPVRPALPILREIVGLTQHVSAQIDSRLAGAGVLFVPEGVKAGTQSASGDFDEADAFTESLVDAMVTPIQDRGAASAIVPLVVSIPEDTAKDIKHVSFSNNLDKEAPALRSESIRRLALAMNMPPEVLLGSGSMNHWGAWLVEEDTIKTHVEPVLALICNALTLQILRPYLEAVGYSTEEANTLSVWYDISDLVSRPIRTEDAVKLYELGEISGKTLREASGFGEEDAPTPEEIAQRKETITEESSGETPVDVSRDIPDMPQL